jgi:hypothetical protein
MLDGPMMSSSESAADTPYPAGDRLATSPLQTDDPARSSLREPVSPNAGSHRLQQRVLSFAKSEHSPSATPPNTPQVPDSTFPKDPETQPSEFEAVAKKIESESRDIKLDYYAFGIDPMKHGLQRPVIMP